MRKILLILIALTSIVLAEPGSNNITNKGDYYETTEKYCDTRDKTTNYKVYSWNNALQEAQTFLDEETLGLVYKYLGVKGGSGDDSYLLDKRGRCGRVASDFVYELTGVNVYDTVTGGNLYEIDRSELQLGDCVYYEWSDGSSHIVVYLGHNLILSGNSDAEEDFIDYGVSLLDHVDDIYAPIVKFYRVDKSKGNYLSCVYSTGYDIYEDVLGTEGC